MISKAPRLIVFSGAGLSAESGLPTFRGDNGLWEGVPITKVCHIATWRENFDAVHEFYDARRVAEAGAEPNAAHRAIAEWQHAWPGRVHVLTQNIDRLLERAGCAGVVHLHGDIRKMHCLACDSEWEIGSRPFDRKPCPDCGTRQEVKPAVVFFGENAPRYPDLYDLVQDLRPQDTVVVVGTSGAVLPADRLFGDSPAHSILVNLEPGDNMNEALFTECLYGPATEHLPELTAVLRVRMG
jgi:NAD-dependent deacetylase